MSQVEWALSIRQPWAELILQGRKTIELRTWETDYRGSFWLHAGKAVDLDLDRSFGTSDPPRGAFVGRTTLVDISPIDAQRWERWRGQHLDSGHYQPGLFAWHLSSAERLRQPVPAPGRLKLFKVDETLAQRLHAALA
ncbi:ASCH domain-containing protein [Streptosporangiaceae bacterium NEAU-GS5]|nr:ASCH domain-containing protein [Streptosporangiaceae bacterium NEAU-GS5]